MWLQSVRSRSSSRQTPKPSPNLGPAQMENASCPFNPISLSRPWHEHSTFATSCRHIKPQLIWLQILYGKGLGPLHVQETKLNASRHVRQLRRCIP